MGNSLSMDCDKLTNKKTDSQTLVLITQPILPSCDNPVATNSQTLVLIPQPIIPKSDTDEQCGLCKKDKILIVLSCSHELCIDCFDSLKFYSKEMTCIICDKRCKIKRVGAFFTMPNY